MKTNIYDLLPENLSDEGAYHLTDFFMKLALELDSIYFAQIRRYINDGISNYPDIIQDKLDDELPF
mgnify:CR=1 FL=1|jgi:hypothetical protein